MQRFNSKAHQIANTGHVVVVVGSQNSGLPVTLSSDIMSPGVYGKPRLLVTKTAVTWGSTVAWNEPVHGSVRISTRDTSALAVAWLGLGRHHAAENRGDAPRRCAPRDVIAMATPSSWWITGAFPQSSLTCWMWKSKRRESLISRPVWKLPACYRTASIRKRVPKMQECQKVSLFDWLSKTPFLRRTGIPIYLISTFFRFIRVRTQVPQSNKIKMVRISGL